MHKVNLSHSYPMIQKPVSTSATPQATRCEASDTFERVRRHMRAAGQDLRYAGEAAVSTVAGPVFAAAMVPYMFVPYLGVGAMLMAAWALEAAREAPQATWANLQAAGSHVSDAFREMLV